MNTFLAFLVWEKSDEGPASEKSGDPFGRTGLWGGCGTGIRDFANKELFQKAPQPKRARRLPKGLSIRVHMKGQLPTARVPSQRGCDTSFDREALLTSLETL